MLEVHNITHRYGTVEALHDVSFSTPESGIIGLLGQNGAGKTTTLNIVTGYMTPVSGQVLLNGHDMLTEHRVCKRLIGYLPEQLPIYDEMTVSAYLTFVCRLKEVDRRDIPRHIKGIMDRCGLYEVSGRVLGHLSKGYRQRVGIAQALCGNPPMLILDEPTVGLDPKQVVEIRELIRTLGKSHTILFSSHLLAEVQQLCSRILILHHGRLVKEADLSSLSGDATRVLHAVIRGDKAVLLPALRSLSFVRELQLQAQEKDTIDLLLICTAEAVATSAAQEALFRLLSSMQAPLLELTEKRDSLEQLFLRITAGEEEGT